MQIPDAFSAPPRVLMGPGPSDVAPSVLRAMSQPLVGHLDPVFVNMMEEIKTMLRAVLRLAGAPGPAYHRNRSLARVRERLPPV